MFSLHTHCWPRSSSWPAHITWIQTNQCWAARHATPGDTLPYHLYICDSETVKSYLYHGNVQNVFKIIFWSYFILADYQWASQSRFCVFPLIQSSELRLFFVCKIWLKYFWSPDHGWLITAVLLVTVIRGATPGSHNTGAAQHWAQSWVNTDSVNMWSSQVRVQHVIHTSSQQVSIHQDQGRF